MHSPAAGAFVLAFSWCCAITPRADRVMGSLRSEAPHLELKASPRHVAPREEVTVTGRLRGYNLTGSDFCLSPRWILYGRTVRRGSLVEIPIDDPVQCRNHEFTHTFSFMNEGVYPLWLELRTRGTKVRLVEQGLIWLDVGGKQ